MTTSVPCDGGLLKGLIWGFRGCTWSSPWVNLYESSWSSMTGWFGTHDLGKLQRNGWIVWRPPKCGCSSFTSPHVFGPVDMWRLNWSESPRGSLMFLANWTSMTWRPRAFPACHVCTQAQRAVVFLRFQDLGEVVLVAGARQDRGTTSTHDHARGLWHPLWRSEERVGNLWLDVQVGAEFGDGMWYTLW
jgi:hypothetical protein